MCRVNVISMEGDWGELISGEGVGIRVGWKGREGVAERGCHGLLVRKGVLKGGGHRQIEGGERSRYDK